MEQSNVMPPGQIYSALAEDSKWFQRSQPITVLSRNIPRFTGVQGSRNVFQKGFCFLNLNVANRSSIIYFSAICVSQDWRRYQNSCFKLFHEYKTWISANKSCEKINSTLVSIHSSEENDAVHKLIVKNDAPAWIGLTNLNSIGLSYEWVDGSNLSFTNWGYGEPSYSHQGTFENCTEMGVSGSWNDVNQNHSLMYVCGKKISPQK